MGSSTTTKRFTSAWGLVVFGLLAASAAHAQVVSTRIVTDPPGRDVQVDGQIYRAPVTFLWPVGSRHTIHAYDQIDTERASTRWTFTGITPSGPTVTECGANTLCVSATPEVPQYTVSFQSVFRIRVIYFDCAGYAQPGEECPENVTPGKVIVGGATFTQNGEFYAPAGVLTLQAIPSAAGVENDSPWVFVGWGTAPSSGTQAFVTSVTITGPTNIYPIFTRGRKITIESNPTGLQVLADRAPVYTPHKLVWGINTTHQLGSFPDQVDIEGKVWVFNSWSNGGSINHPYTVPGDAPGPLTLTANFVPGQGVTFQTNPAGIPLTVDGRSNWVSTNFKWAAGSVHTVSAPATYVGEDGTRYTFRNWSNGGPAEQSITATLDPEGRNIILVANYDSSGPVTVTSQTAGISIKVDGADCALPCKIEKDHGTSIHLAATPSVAMTENSRLDFSGWGDSSELERTITAPSKAMNLSVNYTLKNRLTLTSNPPDGAVLTTQPASSDGFFTSGSDVVVTAEAKTGYRFQNWEGDQSSAARSITVKMSSPRSLVAALESVPTLGAGAVKNAAGVTPGSAVAAGSIVSIYGVNLAPELKIGPTSPLAQTLADVTVRVGSRLLGLLFVSPGQINAQLPYDLGEGEHTLTVSWTGKPEVSTTFQVARNAPGLFHYMVEGRAYGLIFHADGSLVTRDNPAKRSETLTLLGTGLGPYLEAPPAGFAIPESAVTALADPAVILSGAGAITPSYAGLAGGRVGVNAIRFQAGAALDSGDAEIRVQVNGQDSNSVYLTVE